MVTEIFIDFDLHISPPSSAVVHSAAAVFRCMSVVANRHQRFPTFYRLSQCCDTYN